MDYDAIADLPLRVEDWSLSVRERDTSSGFARTTTVVELRGGGHRGRGEDVTYEDDAHPAFGGDPPAVTGEFDFDGFSARLGDVDLFPSGTPSEAAAHYRRWAVESAALDLALRQAGESLGSVLGREYDPVRFVASTRLGDPPTTDRIEQFRELDPGMEFKLDPSPEWSAELIEQLAATGAVRVIDLKGQYEGDWVEMSPDPDLYERLIEGFPDAIVEDPALTDDTRPVVDRARERVSWDLPITGVDSVRDLPFEPEWINVKPSRFGTVESLFATLSYCRDRGIDLYGGGQFELDVGRDQVQALASLLYPDAPNDVAPGAYNDPELSPDLPTSPLDPDPGVGFGWA